MTTLTTAQHLQRAHAIARMGASAGAASITQWAELDHAERRAWLAAASAAEQLRPASATTRRAPPAATAPIAYQPRPSGVPARLIKWLRQQPAGTTISTAEAATMFDILPASVYDTLRLAVTSGMLRRDREYGVIVYRLAGDGEGQKP